MKPEIELQNLTKVIRSTAYIIEAKAMEFVVEDRSFDVAQEAYKTIPLAIEILADKSILDDFHEIFPSFPLYSLQQNS